MNREPSHRHRPLGHILSTAAKAVSALESLGILQEISGRQRDQMFAYKAHLDRLRKGADLSR